MKINCLGTGKEEAGTGESKSESVSSCIPVLHACVAFSFPLISAIAYTVVYSRVSTRGTTGRDATA